MISVIICSRTSEINPVFYNNINKTIGSAHEFIIIDNSQNKYSIFEAYNIGIAKSQGDYWCFIHDDILFHSQDWGKVVERIFEQDSKIGLIGVAGTKVKTKMPSVWWDCSEQYKVINIIQHLDRQKNEHWHQGFHHESTIEEVVVIDGVFMAARRVDSICFSNKLTGFHNYDLNLSFEYLKRNYKIVVSDEILLDHFSMGSINFSWYQSSIKLHSIYKNLLPLQAFSQTSLDIKKNEFENGSKFLIEASSYINKLTFIQLWMKLIILKPRSKRHFIFFKLLLQ